MNLSYSHRGRPLLAPVERDQHAYSRYGARLCTLSLIASQFGGY